MSRFSEQVAVLRAKPIVHESFHRRAPDKIDSLAELLSKTRQLDALAVIELCRTNLSCTETAEEFVANLGTCSSEYAQRNQRQVVLLYWWLLKIGRTQNVCLREPNIAVIFHLLPETMKHFHPYAFTGAVRRPAIHCSIEFAMLMHLRVERIDWLLGFFGYRFLCLGNVLYALAVALNNNFTPIKA